MPIPRRGAAAGLFALCVCGSAAAVTMALMPTFHVAPDYVSRVMTPMLLNPCQPGTPCGDAAKAKYGITPQKIMMDSFGSLRRDPGSAGGQRDFAAASDTAPDLSATTRYTPSPQVSEAVKAQFIRQISQNLGPAQGQKIAAVLTSHDIVVIWAREMAPNGLHPDDLADAIASYWVLNWVIANHADTDRSKMVAVRNQIWRTLAADRVGQLPDASREAAAEAAIIQFVIQSAIYENALRTHEEDVVAKFADAAEERFMAQMKIDLRGLALTDQGFARKS
jgi:hypothetical protein